MVQAPSVYVCGFVERPDAPPKDACLHLDPALARVGFPAEALRPGNRSRSLCLFLHDRPDVTGAVCACVWAQLGLRRAPDLSQVTLADGNLLFNLGSVLPNRLVVGVLYCLVHWGADEHETRVRAQSSHGGFASFSSLVSGRGVRPCQAAMLRATACQRPS